MVTTLPTMVVRVDYEKISKHTTNSRCRATTTNHPIDDNNNKLFFFVTVVVTVVTVTVTVVVISVYNDLDSILHK
jgi:hypothetical protein